VINVEASLASQGGNSHQRAVQRSRSAPADKNTAKEDPKIVIPVPPQSRVLSTEIVLNVLLGITGIVLTIIGISDVYPLWVNICFYVGVLSVILWGVSRWERLSKLKGYRKVIVMIVVTFIYFALLFYPVSEQYKRENSIAITFKASPLFTFSRKQIIRHDLTNVKQYLKDLNVNVPSDLPPIAVRTGKNTGGCAEVTPPGLPLYRSEFDIGAENVGDRKTTTQCYIEYVVNGLAVNNSKSNNFMNVVYGLGISQGIAEYLNMSFWNEKETNPQLYAYELWGIREHLGKAFADNLAVAMLKIISDTPDEIGERSIGLYFAAALKLAESVVDNECAHWPTIRQQFIGMTSGGKPVTDDLEAQDFSKFHISQTCLDQWKQNN
jgi:hypothetical protein